MEASIRKGNKFAPAPKKRYTKAAAVRHYTHAFMVEYIFRQSQCSPSDKILYVDFCGLRSLYELYCKECTGKKLAFSSFAREWNRRLCKGVVDPETAVQYVVNIRKSRSKGFKKCDRCCFLKMQIAGTAKTAKRAARQRKLEEHIEDINCDRETLARIQRMCITQESHAGFFIDAADSGKFAIPTTR